MTQRDLTFMPDFFDRYITLVPKDEALLSGLRRTADGLEQLREQLIAFQDFQYQPGKWTPKAVVQHIIDNERIQIYRALAFSRNETAVLPGYDQDIYAQNAIVEHRTVEELLAEFQTVRAASISLFESLVPEQFHKEGICFKVKVTPLALGLLLIGHQIHHTNVLEERYFKS